MLALQAKRGILHNLSLRKQQEIAEYYMKLLSIKASSMEQRIDQLSGESAEGDFGEMVSDRTETPHLR